MLDGLLSIDLSLEEMKRITESGGRKQLLSPTMIGTALLDLETQWREQISPTTCYTAKFF